MLRKNPARLERNEIDVAEKQGFGSGLFESLDSDSDPGGQKWHPSIE
jgi:hypothetical protein